MRSNRNEGISALDFVFDIAVSSCVGRSRVTVTLTHTRVCWECVMTVEGLSENESDEGRYLPDTIDIHGCYLVLPEY